MTAGARHRRGWLRGKLRGLTSPLDERAFFCPLATRFLRRGHGTL